MTDKRPLVSIVANFYNSASFIPKLVKSVLAQTYGQWELIAVNDCSPGRDREVLERWAATPEAGGRIRVINNPANQGITRAKQTVSLPRQESISPSSTATTGSRPMPWPHSCVP